MSGPRVIPAEEVRRESRVKNSRFIATLGPAFSVEDARKFIERIKREFSDASHNVPAFVIGHAPAVTAHSSDDGEPSGTAGRPVLSVLQGSGLGDVVVVVTRYFGGTKLGSGGLVRAYGDAAREIVAVVPRAEKVATHRVKVAASYNLLERIQLLVEEHQGELLERDFAADITLSIQIRIDKFEAFNMDLREMSSGLVAAEIQSTNSETIMPISERRDE